jgi:hypothetical protein
MATWKEKGVVPDSDDEDFLDSQSIADLKDLSNKQRHNESQERHDDISEGENGGNNGREFGQEKRPFRTETSSAQDTNVLPQTPKRTSIADKQEYAELPLSSPISPRVFKDPRTLWASESNRPTPVGGQATPPAALLDEVSQSYVRLTSPMSSALSSLPGSQMSQNIWPKTLGEVESSLNGHNLDSVTEQTGVQTSEEPISFNKRAFRQRNPIQLHPYVVEQEKYRRTLQARGLKPMRLAQSQDHHTKPNTDGISQESDSQELYSEDVEMEECQPMKIHWNSSPPSPVAKSRFGDAESNDSESVSREDDDFPDIDELIKGRVPISRPPKPKRRLKSYSSKYTRPQLSRVQSHAVKNMNRRGSHDIFDVPASPPTTSSPFSAITRPNKMFLSRRTSISSKEPTPSWLDEDELTFQRSTDLPTPATSATKPVPDAIPIDSDSDIDDPFASEPDPTLSASSSDGSSRIRKVGKKIRGVLPASHLRLDQHLKKSMAPSRTQRESLTASPVNNPFRRGVALPKQSRTGPSATLSSNTGLPFLSEDSESDEDIERAEFIMADEAAETDRLFAQQRMGYAEEDDRIDAMLPSGKRHGRGPDLHPRKKRRVGSTSFKADGTRARQPKITEHLVKPRKSTSSKTHRSRRPGYHVDGPLSSRASRPRRSAPPKLSILDVISSPGGHIKELPQFIRVAARTARSKKHQGRQSPTRKYIRLANRGDTFDAQSVLQEWKDGKIQQKTLHSSHATAPSRAPLKSVSGNVQSRLRSPVSRPKSSSYGLADNNRILPRKLIVPRERQRTINDFVTTTSPTTEQSLPKSNISSGLGVTRKRLERPRYIPQSRPAQLESSELQYNNQHPTAAFKTSKKALDSLYRSVRKRSTPQANLQLSRFLADDDVLRPSIETKLPVSRDNSKSISEAPKLVNPPRKRLPRRLDVGAAVYRQPSEPLILEFLASSRQDVSGQDNKLEGLGNFGTHYPTHFDIFPMQPGTFFHESTFIGSGRLSAVIKNTGVVPSDFVQPRTSFQIAEKEFLWGPWDENVSSEIGLCFDWLAEQLNLRPGPETSAARDTVEVMATVIEYMQHSLSFTAPEDRLDFLTRMLEIVNDLLSRVTKEDQDSELLQTQLKIEVLARCSVLTLFLLRISRHYSENFSVIGKIEDLVVDVSRSCMKPLLAHGVEDIRKLYDDLQYLSLRERGIRESQYAFHALVVLHKVLDAAQIPRKSFWDVANTQLVDKDMAIVNDARMMEKLWYTMFTLLPLCEFDESGVVIQDARRTASFDNWWLPQQLLKWVFALYSLNPRQSPSFNDYCRTIVSRCHFLMAEWGWWKCSGMIGTLFDFFASQNLAHLRNEEVHKSPYFLDHLASQPSLAIEPEDRCFHIFLKIVALAIKHMNSTNNERDVRNLVARLLPNHNRQYPKEESIHEREVAALRNHHDLLCTLYWAAPPSQRPSLTLIQDLVEADRSHNAACLINLRSWNQLAQFVLVLSDPRGSFKPFISWQNTFFAKLWEQYLQEDNNTRRQAELHTTLGAEPITETRLQQQISNNRIATMATLRMVLSNISDAITLARNDLDLTIAFNTSRYMNATTKPFADFQQRTFASY